MGPFDNDDATDFCVMLRTTDPADRPELLRQALATTADTTGYLQIDDASQAVAAAAIVASLHPGGTPIPAQHPAGFLNDEPLALPPDMPTLALRALDRVIAGDSEWHQLWSEATTERGNPAFDTITTLRAQLSA